MAFAAKNWDYNITNIINYLRRSRQDVQREKLTGEDTLLAQEKLMNGVLEGLGIPYHQKKEIGSGDKISKRPVFQGILEELKMGKYDAIAVKEISRLGRGSYSDMGIIYELIIDKRILIITPHRIYDPTNQTDLRQIRFEMFFAREEFETTRERLTTARYNSAIEGKWMAGKVPYGYERNRKTNRLEIIEDEADVIRMIYDLYINGYEGKMVRERAIGTILKRAGILTAQGKKTWETSQIHKYLTNEAYIGIAKFRTTKRNSEGKVEKRPAEEHIVKEDAHDKIISVETFNKVQDLMKEIVPRTKLDAQTYPFTGIVTCSCCGHKLRVNKYKRKRMNDEYFDIYFKCRTGCFTIKYNYVEMAIEKLMQNLKEVDSKTIAEMYEKTNAVRQENEKEQMMEMLKESAEKKKEDLQNRLKFIQDKHFKGIYTDDDYLGYKKEIDAEMIEVEKLLNGVNETAVTNETIDPKKVENKMITIIDAYKKSDSNEKKNELLRNLFQKITLEVKEKGRGGNNPQAPKFDMDITLSLKFWDGIETV